MKFFILLILSIAFSVAILAQTISTTQDIHILHFNDVYQIFEWKKEPIAGAARFKTAIDHFRHLDPLIIFSGDAYSPSTLTPATKGAHMVYPLNEIGVHVSCIGNHEFDIGLEELEKRIQEANFPWLLTNVINRDTGKPLAGAKEYHILKKFGQKIGFVCLAEDEWVADIISLPREDIHYTDFVESAKKYNKFLREQEGVDMVIALTHMRSYNDKRLAEEFQGFDLILGGHDHVNELEKVNGTYYVKSGCEFKEFSKIVLSPINKISEEPNLRKEEQEEKEREIYKDKYYFERETIIVNSSWSPDPALKKFVQEKRSQLQASFQKVIGVTAIDLETRFEKIRTSEQNFPNFIADLVRVYYDAEIALFAGGTFRSDRIIHQGIIHFGDLKETVPFVDLILILEMTGKEIYESLENGVAWYPDFVGRFPAVSGIKFQWDPDREPFKRVIKESIWVEGRGWLDMNERYKVTATEYQARGGDGYQAMMRAKRLNSLNNAEDMMMVALKFFELRNIPGIKQEWDKGHLNQCRIYDECKHWCEDVSQPPFDRINSSIIGYNRKVFDKLSPLIKDIVQDDNGETLLVIEPKIDGRNMNIREHLSNVEQQVSFQ